MFGERWLCDTQQLGDRFARCRVRPLEVARVVRRLDHLSLAVGEPVGKQAVELIERLGGPGSFLS